MIEVSFEEQINRLAQIIAEDTYSKSNIRKNIKAYLEQDMDNKILMQLAILNIEGYLQDKYYASKNARLEHIKHISAEDLMLEVMIAVCPLEKATTIQKPASEIGARFEYDDIFDGIKTAAELLTLCAISGLIRIYPAGKFEDSITVCSLTPPSQKISDWLLKIRYMNPMLCEPEHWVSNTGGGYITNNDSVLLGKQTHHDDKQCFDALNILQDIAWELDPDVLKEDELPKKMFEEKAGMSVLEQVIAFLQMVRVSREVYGEMGDNPFWFEWKFDFRGRAYSVGYYINLQASSYKKALLNFAKKEKVI